MPGPRQRLSVLEANGRKHLSKAEKAERAGQEVTLPKPAKMKVPRWLPEHLKADFRALAKELLEADMGAAQLDRDTLGRYVAAQHPFTEACRMVQDALDQEDPDRRSIGWEVHEKCRRLLAWRRGEPERELDGDLPEWCPIMFGIGILTGDDPDRIDALDIYDEKLWYACNPGLGHNLRLSDFRREARAARQSEAAERLFRWLRLNQWIAVKAVSWVPVTIYDKTQFNRPEWAGMNVLARRRAVREYLRGKRCFGGLDLSKSTDLTALVLLFPPQEGLEIWAALFWGWVPLDDLEARETRDGVPYGDWLRADFLQGCEGDINDYDAVEQTIWQAAEEFDLVCLGLDPAMSWTLSQRLMQSTAEHGAIPVVEIRQNMTGMSPATKQLEVLLRKGEMLHEHNTAARWCFGNVRCATDGNENMKPMKNRSVGRIDITVAWIIAMAAAMLKDAEKPDLAAALGREDFSL